MEIVIKLNNEFVILISGPTATGKSDFALELGKTLPIEIVNADIGSFYKELTIGTAKPDWENQTVHHHFFDVIDDTNSWTAPRFREELKQLIPEIWSRGNIPVIVGGSAFYIQSFFYNTHDLVSPTQDLMQSLEEQPHQDLWQQLHDVDPERAEKISPMDKYRVVRALAIWHTQGKKPSDFQQVFNPLTPFHFITLTRDRDQLYEMIDQRVLTMIDSGWLDEVRGLVDDSDWVNFLLNKKMIGYDLLAGYLMGDLSELDFSEIVSLIQQRTRNYAKRQLTFLKKLSKNIQFDCKKISIEKFEVEECNLTLCDLSLYIKQLSERISLFLK